MKHTEEMIKKVSQGISNPSYQDNLQATKELMELFDYLKEHPITKLMAEKPLETWEDYVRMYDDNFYTYSTWDELVESEEEQGSYGLTKTECEREVNKTIWKLSCGWFVQYV